MCICLTCMYCPITCARAPCVLHKVTMNHNPLTTMKTPLIHTHNTAQNRRFDKEIWHLVVYHALLVGTSLGVRSTFALPRILLCLPIGVNECIVEFLCVDPFILKGTLPHNQI